MFGNYENKKCANSDCWPTSFVFEDEPFGSEMSCGRGICDTDPIPKLSIRKSCQSERDKFAVNATPSIDGAASAKYFTISEDKVVEDIENPDGKGLPNRTSRSNSSRDASKRSFLSTGEDYFFEDSAVSYKKRFERKQRKDDFKLAGPLTEPPNPGKQMKLGKYRAESVRIGRDFYKDF